MEKIKENLKSYHLSSDEVETLLADYGNKITPVNYAKLKNVSYLENIEES
jgi:hypothetical protein